ncbi:MAG TPA: FeoA family protein [Chitinophagaceae bacterium]|nr:FeoA family protein [Chitinophagaceae bacterium]
MDKKLSELKPGQRGIIKDFNNNEISIKLMEMGCLPGEEVIMEQIAPMGGPVSIGISGYTLSLRINEAEQIMVTVKY